MSENRYPHFQAIDAPLGGEQQGNIAMRSSYGLLVARLFVPRVLPRNAYCRINR